ncbi:MAG: hypothetical protein KGQ59_08970 [Bdellovibrionales bacterium]|nr:hypothetical protein [Bdellovibrionales bacterium]
MYVRSDWKKASQFHDLSEREVLKEVYRRVAQCSAHQQVPVVLLDLDSTLYEVGPRTHQILREWLDTAEARAFPNIRSELARLEQEHVGYSLRDTFSALGVAAPEQELQQALSVIKTFWQARFFSNDYLKYDRAYEGAAEFVQEVHGMGAFVVYLTGRDEPGMGAGTRSMLIRDRFPWATERTHLLLKAAYGLSDLEHKVNASSFIRKTGELVASFENEPANLVAIYEQFPQAMHVFVETVSSDHAAPAAMGLYRICGFR